MTRRIMVVVATASVGAIAALTPLAGAHASTPAPVPIRNGKSGACIGLSGGLGICVPAQLIPGPPGR